MIPGKHANAIARQQTTRGEVAPHGEKAIGFGIKRIGKIGARIGQTVYSHGPDKIRRAHDKGNARSRAALARGANRPASA